MNLSEEQIHGLGTALNEATLLGVEPNPERELVGATFDVLTLPKDGPSQADSRIQIVFCNVGRIAASLRLGRWDDRNAKIEKLEVEQLLDVTQGFHVPIYGWEFFNLDIRELDWLDRLSLDWRGSNDPAPNSFSFFQEGDKRHLDVCLWFGDMSIRRPDGNETPLEEFIGGGKRWWDAFYSGDPRTEGKGIVPLK